MVNCCVHNSRFWSLSWSKLIQFTPLHPIYLRSISIFSSHLRLGLQSGFFHSRLPITLLNIFFFSNINNTRFGHLTPFYFIVQIFGLYHKFISSSLPSFLQSSDTSSQSETPLSSADIRKFILHNVSANITDFNKLL
jgi:hypothetical protein